jgi:hypothetical protein
MYKSKLIRLYQTLDDSEIRQLKKWIKSPIHNKHNDVQVLFEYLLSRKGISSITTDRERVYQYLYPNKKMNMPRLRHVMSFATDVLENFIRYIEYVSDKKNGEILLLRSFRKRDLRKDAEKQELALLDGLENETIQNEEYYWTKYQLELESFRLQTDTDQPTSTNFHLQEVMNSSSLVFVLSILRYACISITHQNLFKTKYDIPFIDAILLEIEAGNYASIHSIQFYHACYMALTKPEVDDNYKRLKQYIVQYPDILPADEFRELYEMAINYCIKRLNKGNRYYIEEAFDLYMNGIDHEVLLENGYLSHIAYKNTVAIGLHLEKFEEVKALIPRGKDLLHLEYQESYVHYNTANFYFATKDYDKAIQLLISMEYDDLFMTIGAKLLLLKIYVTEESFDLLESFLHSFAQFVRRKSELSSTHKQSFLDTIRLTQKVVDAYTKKQKAALIEEITATNPLPEKRWLLERLGVVST